MVGLAPASVFAQTDQTVAGRVVTATDKSSLPGASIVVKGTTTGTSTNPDGSFTLQVPAGATLTIASIGFITQEVPASASPINVTLAEEKIKQVPVQNLTQALRGRAAGVDVAGGNFRPGESPAIRIRGNRSVRASNEPLYVVDGIPLAQGTGPNDFNPDDIESVEVLKDASATAIYGSRGANGVVIVTTKRGKEGKFSINHNAYGSFERPLRNAFTQNHQLSASGGSENLRASLSVGGSTNASLSAQNVGPDIYGKAVGQLPYATPYNAKGVFQTNPGPDANILTPLLDPENTFNERRVARFFTSLYAEARLLEGLRYRLNVGPDFRNARNGQFRSARSTGQGRPQRRVFHPIRSKSELYLRGGKPAVLRQAVYR